MYSTNGARSVCDDVALDYDVNARVSWLKGELARAEACAPQAPRRDEEAADDFVLGPALTPSEAYAWFGLFLGLFPPAAIFCRFLFSLTGNSERLAWPILICAAMTAVCCFVGSKMGGYVGRMAGNPGGHSWPGLLLKAVLLSTLWGVVTGAAGGAVCFGFGALGGPVFAVPVALVAFPIFASLHRLLSRGGMIEERSLWPLAYGVPGVIAAAILSIR